MGEQDDQLATIVRHETIKMSWRGVKKELENKSTVLKSMQFILDMAEKVAAIPAKTRSMAQIVPLCGIAIHGIHPVFLGVIEIEKFSRSASASILPAAPLLFSDRFFVTQS